MMDIWDFMGLTAYEASLDTDGVLGLIRNFTGLRDYDYWIRIPSVAINIGR